jgi:hypothetical protein
VNPLILRASRYVLWEEIKNLAFEDKKENIQEMTSVLQRAVTGNGSAKCQKVVGYIHRGCGRRKSKEKWIVVTPSSKAQHHNM